MANEEQKELTAAQAGLNQYKQARIALEAVKLVNEKGRVAKMQDIYPAIDQLMIIFIS